MESPHLATIAEHPTNYDDEVADELLEDFSPDEREEGNNGEEDEGNQKMSNGGVCGNFLVQHLRDRIDNKDEEMERLSPDDHEERNNSEQEEMSPQDPFHGEEEDQKMSLQDPSQEGESTSRKRGWADMFLGGRT